MRSIRRVAIYCGSAAGTLPAFREAAEHVGRLLAGQGIEVVFGGGGGGLMGAVAGAALAAGGRVTGVIPNRLVGHEVAHEGLTVLIVVDSMHARKTVMCGLSDAFMVLPGGYGTLDELFEAVTWTQLGFHHKPVGLLDVEGYFAPLLAFLDHARDHGFIRPSNRAIVTSAAEPEALLERLRAAELPTAP
jgi:uncharacterized protein (TIGR00730 family)